MEHSTNTYTQNDYISRINSVFDYIEQNLEHDFSLDELASVSCFSKYHFSRIFDAIVGETPFEFIKRLRLEKSASLLRIHSGQTVTEIALKCGFNNLEVFSRNFSDFFGMAPTKWRNGKSEKSNHNQAFDLSSKYLASEANKNLNLESLQSAEIKDLSQKTVAYLRHTGPYKGDEELFNRLLGQLFDWAGPRGFLNRRNSAPLVIYHDDPCVTKEEKLRISVCLPVPSETPVDGEIGKMDISGGRSFVARFIIAAKKMPDAWQWIYGSWFPSTEYIPADALPFEVYPKPLRGGKLTVEICIPVQVL